MHWKLGKRRLRLPTRSTVLGGGLLERARSTTLALLGLTAAVGLGMVALALNQSWPLLAGSPIPGIPSGDVALEDATVVARAPRNGRGGEAGSADRPRESERHGGDSRSGRDRGATPAASDPRDSSQLVVAASTPVDSETGDGPHPPAAKKPKPAPAPAPKPEAAAPAAAAAQPAASPPPAAEPAEEPPSGASAAGAEPEESGPPSWSNGDGHGYGRGRSDWHDHDHGHDDWDDDDRDWDRDRDWHD